MAKKRKDGRLQRKFKIDGKTYYVYGKTAAELNEKQMKKTADIKSRARRRHNPTLDEFYERWTAGRVNVKASTIYTQKCEYKTASEVVVGGLRFGDLKVSEIQADDIRTLQKKLSEKETANYVNQIIKHISHLLNAAVDDEIIDKNPCKAVQYLKITKPPARENIHRALTIEETERFFAGAAASHYRNLYRFALATGMRVGEIGALKNSDIKGGLIHIDHTLTRTEKGVEIGHDTKTKASKRQIPLNANIKAIISDQRKQNEILFGEPESIDGLLFRGARGAIICERNITTDIARICQAQRIEAFTIHAFRDTFATRMIEAGVNPKTVQELLGHGSFSMTMDLYAHVMTDTKKKAMEQAEKLLQFAM